MNAISGLILAVGAMGLAAWPASAEPSATSGAYGFIVQVSLSPKAAVKLAALRETISLAASYQGDPVPSAIKHANEMGEVELGRENLEISGGGGIATFTGRTFKTERIAWLTAAGPEVNVNAFSSRHSGPDNLLDCEFFQDKVSVARREPIKLNCKLIGEP